MDDKERRDFERQVVVQDYAAERQELTYQQQAKRERYGNIPEPLRPYWAVGEMAINVITVPLEVLMRRHFGVRYLTTGRVILAIIFYTLIVGWVTGANGGAREVWRWDGDNPGPGVEYQADIPDLFVAFGVLWIPAALYNLWVIKRRQRRRVRWHTMSTGIAYLEGRVPGGDWALFRLWEPLLWLALGAGFFIINPMFGLYLIAAGTVMLVRNHQLYMEHITGEMDRTDMQIVAEFNATGGRPGGKGTNAGYQPVTTPYDMTARIEDIEPDLFSRQRLRTIAMRASRAREDVGSIVSDVTGKQMTGEPPAFSTDGRTWRHGEPSPATPPAAARPTTPATPAPASVWHQAEDWPDYETSDNGHRAPSANGSTPA